MKILYILFFIFFIFGCVAQKPPIHDISNAKISLIKAENSKADKYASHEFSDAKSKLVKSENLMKKGDYKKAKLFAQKASADARVATQKAKKELLEEEVKKLEGEINMITKDFVQIEEK